MIDFQTELQKYKPISEISDMEDTLQHTQMQDLLDILQYIANDQNHKKTNIKSE